MGVRIRGKVRLRGAVKVVSKAGQENMMDRSGHMIDPSVGYARGDILSSPLEESRRHQHALHIIQRRVTANGVNGFFNFTGLHRDYQINPQQISLAEEWVGPGLFADELAKRTLEHLGGGPEHAVAVFNRATAGIVAACLALATPGSKVISVVPGTRSHPSLARGVALASAELEEISTLRAMQEILNSFNVSLIVITGVSSELEVIDECILMEAIRLARAYGIASLLDDAYGARLRPIIYGQPKTLTTGVDLGITSCDKAGLGGPRAGLMAGRPDLMSRVMAQAGELGLEARPPLSLGVCASLANFDPSRLRREVELGGILYERLGQRFGTARVKRTGLGATIPEEDAWELVRALRPAGEKMSLVPAEITAGMGIYWLKRYGMITVNALGQPGARVSLRFKPDPAEVERFGGTSALLEAIADGFRAIAEKAGSPSEMKKLILGE